MLRQRCGSKSPQWGEVKEKTRYFAAACEMFEKRAAVEDCVEKFFLDEKTFLFVPGSSAMVCGRSSRQL
jgi:hypothetical protein